MRLDKENENIAYIIPYPYDQAPGQRFRFEQYLDVIQKEEYSYKLFSFLSPEAFTSFYSEPFSIFKLISIIRGYFYRILLLLKISKFDLLYIFREATPLGPPWFEFIAAKILKKKIIYDFDDAIWLEDPDEKGTLLAKLKYKNKVGTICRWSYKISAGNEYLANYARQYNSNVSIIPTTVDTEGYHNPELYDKSTTDIITIGWTGTHSTLQYLDLLVPVIKKLEQKYKFRFLVIANKNPQYDLKSIEYLEWNRETEIEDLSKIDIGLMPLTDDQWSKGKCGFKLLQYMALKIPAVASPVGVNKIIIDEEVSGFLCSNQDDFYDKLQKLLSDDGLRRRMGKKGRQKVVAEYSVEANKEDFLSLFK